MSTKEQDMKKDTTSPATKFKFVTRKISELTPNPRNSRIHSEAQVAQLAASIKEFGFTNPVLIDEQNIIIAGEGRVTAAKKLQLAEVSCIVLTGLSEAQKAAYVIADNKLALASCWDTDMLAAELGSLADQGFSLDLTGFSEVEMLTLLAEVDAAVGELVQTTDVADVPMAPPSQPLAPQHPAAAQPSKPPAEAGVHPAQAAWTGMPEFDQPSDMPFRTIHLHFACQEAVDAFRQLIARTITDRTKYMWFPEQPKIKNKGGVYA